MQQRSNNVQMVLHTQGKLPTIQSGFVCSKLLRLPCSAARPTELPYERTSNEAASASIVLRGGIPIVRNLREPSPILGLSAPCSKGLKKPGPISLSLEADSDVTSVLVHEPLSLLALSGRG